MTNAIDMVIFDLDGTLVDSQPAALGGTIEALSRFGVQVTATDLRKVFGGGAWKLVGHFLERDLGSDRARDLLEEAVQLRSSLQLELTNEVVLLPDVTGLLASLKDSGHKLAIATMSGRVVPRGYWATTASYPTLTRSWPSTTSNKASPTQRSYKRRSIAWAGRSATPSMPAIPATT